jgi:hypothetical protein
MVLWNLLESGPSRNAPLLGPSVSLRGGTLGTNPCHSRVGVGEETGG